MSPQYVDSLETKDIDPNKTDKFINLNNMYLGIQVLEMVQSNQNNALKEDFFNRCRMFLITACVQIRARYDFSKKLYGLLDNLTPKKVLNGNNRLPTLFEIMNLVPRIVSGNEISLKQLIDDEWRNLVNHIPDLNAHINEEIDIFWSKLGKIKDGNDELLFKNVSNFCVTILSIPHSNATCERIFSKVNLTKTKTRNKLITNTVNGILLSSQCIKEFQNCVKFSPNEKMISYAQSSKKLYKNYLEKNEVKLCNVDDETDTEQDEIIDPIVI